MGVRCASRESAEKLLLQYLERAFQLEKLAATEADENFKAQLRTQSQAYRKMAAKRARDYGLPAPSAVDLS
ncbi:hypothetical protein WN72_44615 [Bradyrhizobium arachidis]|uniref:Uncharacterized protein n=1 Tax=Bradyrhizobium arachidis TaxID=858423 RepID=A0AAE7P1Y2_9BRAD|nr:hypothetical protein WN72_44615 [Bradyrhizobium arachidis]